MAGRGRSLTERRYTYRCEYVKCGKGACRTCPHGPYWYGYYREGPRIKKRYFGLVDPRGEQPEENPFAAIFCKDLANESLACVILGVGIGADERTTRAAYLRAVKEHHPDRGGEPGRFELAQAAWSWLKAFKGFR